MVKIAVYIDIRIIQRCGFNFAVLISRNSYIGI